MIYQISSLFLHWRSRASFFSPERFSFYAFSGILGVIFDLWDLLDLFVNFFLDLLSSVVANLWLKFYFDSLRLERVFFYLKFESCARSLLVFSVPASALSLFERRTRRTRGARPCEARLAARCSRQPRPSAARPGSARWDSVYERAEPGSARQFAELAEEARLGSKLAREPGTKK